MLQKRKTPRNPRADVTGASASASGAAARARVSHLDWDLVRVFLGVASSGRLGSAAERLGLDVSTVSRRLDRLEQELGVTLFERSSSGALATAAAEKLLPAAEEMGRALGELGVALDAVEAEVEGVVRLTAPPGVADVFVAPALVRLHASHPRLRVDLDASVGYADLTRGEADLALRLRRPARGDLVAQKLVSTRSLPAGAPAYVQSLGPTLRRPDEARWIAWGHDLAQIAEARWLERHVSVPPVLRTSSFFAQLAAAGAGLGLVLAPEPYLPHFALTPVKPARALLPAWAALPVSELWLVGHVALRRVPRVAVLWEFLLAEFSRPWQG
jgi:DNA-binding transcriptional LysR family regulator